MTSRAMTRVVLGVGALLAWCAWAVPASAVTIAVAPAETTVTVGDTFTLRIESPDVFTNLKGYQLIDGYNTAVLLFQNFSAGDVLLGGAHSVLRFPTQPDSVWLDSAMLSGTTSTPGVLMYLTFKALAQGDSPITCLGADFRDDQNVSTIPSCTAGLVHVIGGTPVRPSTWGKLKITYR